MWNSKMANWYQYEMARNNAHAQLMSPPYQAYMPAASGMPQAYIHMPQQQFHYNQLQSQPNVNSLDITMGQAQAPSQTQAHFQAQARRVQAHAWAQAHAQAQAQVHAEALAHAQTQPQFHPQQHTWHDYQAQPTQNYNYWYGMQPASGYNYAMRQMPTNPTPLPQAVQQSAINSSQSLSHSELRINNSQQELAEYQSIAARTLYKNEKKEKKGKKIKTERKEASPMLNTLKVEMKKRISQAHMRHAIPLQSPNLVMEESLPSKGTSILRKLNLFAGKRKQVEAQEQASRSKQNS